MQLRLQAPTPLVAITLDPALPPIWTKLEFLNPSGSTKDRIARFILEKAWRQGRINTRTTVVEASSGSTSIAMALACAQLGIRFIAVMPEGVSNERVLMIKAYGGEIRLAPKDGGIEGAIRITEHIAAEDPTVFLPRQFSNTDNAQAHRFLTAREIIDEIPSGRADAVVSGVGTGGTLVGLYEGLCDAGCQPVPVFARPVNFTREADVECCSFSCRIPGVVECVSTIFNPDNLPSLETIEVSDSEALATTRELMRKGFPVGPSSGLNYRAAQLYLAAHPGRDCIVVTVFPDRMERYFTTDLFQPFR
ncbi:MAG: cysteine synthase family protein [Acidobacteria bacterium]|nr:cysteine synthase family protein [Acidobacteriota bacterium]